MQTSAAVGLALIGAGLTVGLLALAALHVVQTGLSPLTAPVSQYGISRYRIGYRVQTIAYGVAGIGAAVGLAAFPRPGAVVALCLVFALSRLAISWFPMDAPGAERTATGRRHWLFALCAFVAAGVGADQVAKLLDRDHLHPEIAAVNSALAAAMLVTLLAMVVDRRAAHGAYFGLIERVFYGCVTAWLVVVAVLLATRL